MSSRLEKAIGYEFSRSELLRQALTHRSHSSPHNERLEFLGDSVLDCVVAAMLYRQFDKLKEGELSRMRASLVRQETLAEIASGLAIGDVVRLGEGELKSGGFRRPSILADTLEAIFGAVYLEAGFETTRGIIEKLYEGRIGRLDPSDAGKDPKTALQEWLQARRLPIPHYILAETRGDAHAQEFEVVCEVPSAQLRVTGCGNSRRNAEQQAARAVLDRLKST